MLKNKFFDQVRTAEEHCADRTQLLKLLGLRRAKKGMFEGLLDEGELEIGQISALIRDIKPAAEVVKDVWEAFCQAKRQIGGWEL
jgi:enoyl-[acyl-carrier protein] reductase II